MIPTYEFYLFYLSKINYLNIFSKFFSFVCVTFKLSILSNYVKYLKGLALYYTLSFFTILKSLYPTNQLVYLEKMTLIQRRSYLT